LGKSKNIKISQTNKAQLNKEETRQRVDEIIQNIMEKIDCAGITRLPVVVYRGTLRISLVL